MLTPLITLETDATVLSQSDNTYCKCSLNLPQPCGQKTPLKSAAVFIGGKNNKQTNWTVLNIFMNPDLVAWLAHVNVRDINKDQTFFLNFRFFFFRQHFQIQIGTIYTLQAKQNRQTLKLPRGGLTVGFLCIIVGFFVYNIERLEGAVAVNWHYINKIKPY